ncbi:MAG: YraN family protein [Firmicutes bacterium]|nr:YraN family protein [Bacillota bacterium]
MTLHNREIGLYGENIAAEYLKISGLSILCRNYRSRCGEIDLIAKDGDTIVFVEVKTRRSLKFGEATEQITGVKQRKIMAVANEYLSKTGCLGYNGRFDVLAVRVLPGGGIKIKWIKSAFDGWR